MEENPHLPRPKKRTQKAQSIESPPLPPPPPTETGECSVDCSGQSCRSCSAALLADCVALCCCPLAVVSLLGLAFIKVPCAMGKRCLGRRKRKEKEKEKEKRKVCVGRKESVRRNEKGSIGKEEDFGAKSVNTFEGEIMEQRNLCGEVIEGDNVLLEMYRVGHLGFGRVSYTGSGTHPSDMGN